MTAHYVTDTWEVEAKVLRTCAMPERHTAVNIAQRLTDTISEWCLMVFCVIHDNARSGSSGAAWIKKKKITKKKKDKYSTIS